MNKFTSEPHLPGLRQPAPANDGLDAPFWEGTQAHELRVQRCANCEVHQWGPEWMCHACNSMELGWVTVGCWAWFGIANNGLVNMLHETSHRLLFKHRVSNEILGNPVSSMSNSPPASRTHLACFFN